jgi:hypothetical protein
MTDHDDIREMRERIDDIAEATERLQELGEENDVPAVERIATRIEGTLTTLDNQVPPELTDD